MSEYECEFSDWLCANTDLVDFMIIHRAPGGASEQVRRQFAKKQSAVRNRALAQIASEMDSLAKRRARLMEDVDSVTNKVEISMRQRVFPDQGMNMELRVLFFAEIELRNLRLSALNMEIAGVIGQMNRLERFGELYESEWLNKMSGTVVKLKDELFTKELGDQEFARKCQRMQAFVEQKKERIEAFEKPLWVTNFSQFFEGLLATAMSRVKKGLSYALPIPLELELERSVFYGDDKSVVEAMDRHIDLVVAGSSGEFVNRMIELCLSFVPGVEERSLEEQSVASLFYLRILFDRLYERCHHLVFQPREQALERFAALAYTDIGGFKLPFECGVTGMTIREYFLNQYFFYSASLFLNEVMFSVNPIDILYLTHRALVGIQKATLMKTLDGKEATFDDLNKLLCFDDLFSCLVGAVLASDVPDLFTIGDFIEKFSPQDCLTSTFEYSQATITALIVYFNKQTARKGDD